MSAAGADKALHLFPTATRPRAAARLTIAVLALTLAAPIILWAMSLISDASLAAAARSLSERLGHPVSIGAIEATLAPSVELRDVRVGDLLHAERIELAVGLDRERWQPRIEGVRLVKPVLAWRLAAPTAKARASSAAGHSADRRRPPPSWASWRSRVTVEDGTVVLAAGRWRLRAAGIFSRPREGGGQRIVVGRTEIFHGSRRVAQLAAVGVDFDGKRAARRLAGLGGTLQLPGGASLQLLWSRLERAKDGSLRLALKARPLEQDGGGLVLRARLRDGRPSLAAVELARLELRDLSLSRFSALLEPLGLAVLSTRVDGQLDLRRTRAGVVVGGDLAFADLLLEHPRVARRTVGPIRLRLAGAATFAADGRGVTIDRLHVASGKLSLRAEGRVDLPDGAPPRLRLALHVPPLPCQAALAALPKGFAPKLEGMSLRGRIGLRAALKLDTARADRGEVSVRLSPLRCRVIADPPQADVHRLKRQVTVWLSGASGGGERWVVGRANRAYRPLRRISRYVQHAFVAAEDARFFRHRGFDTKQLKRAFLINLQERRLLRGASTISQQLIKNIFLSHERTLSRKVQEAVLTWRMEQLIPKRRILELYLNMVEMGPGIYGVDQAAHAYFGRSAEDLGPSRAAKLAALTPAPRLYAKMLPRLEEHPLLKRRVELLMRLMQRSRATRSASPSHGSPRVTLLTPRQGP